jgi:hypothetical protein
MTFQMRLCLQDFNPCIAPLLQESKLGNVFSQSKPFFSISQHNRVDLIVQRFLHPPHLRRDQPPKYLHRHSCCRSALGQNTPRCTTPFPDTFHLRHRVPSCPSTIERAWFCEPSLPRFQIELKYLGHSLPAMFIQHSISPPPFLPPG